jgi:starvation-inducible DNA-binding protein
MTRSDAKKPLVEAASRLLADSYTLYLKTHNYHWNVTGPMFGQLHALFETQYTELAAAVDVIAERIRTLGAPAPGSYAAFSRLATIKEAPDAPPAAEEMIHHLAADQDAVVASANLLLKAAESADDAATLDLATRRIDVHEKNAWMLRSHLG